MLFFLKTTRDFLQLETIVVNRIKQSSINVMSLESINIKCDVLTEFKHYFFNCIIVTSLKLIHNIFCKINNTTFTTKALKKQIMYFHFWCQHLIGWCFYATYIGIQFSFKFRYSCQCEVIHTGVKCSTEMACFMFVGNEAECLMSLQPLLTWPDWFVPSQMWEPHNVKGDVMAAITAISI